MELSPQDRGHVTAIAFLEAAGRSDHPKDACEICIRAKDAEVPVAGEKTYSEDELQTAMRNAVAAAVAQVRAEKDEAALAAEQAKAVDEAVSAAVTPLKAEIDQLKTDLDTARVERDAEKSAREKLEADQAEKDRLATEAAETAARKDERIAKVREAAKNLADKDLDQLCADSADWWASMEDASFDRLVANLTAAAASAVPASNRPPRAPTAMTAAAEEDALTPAPGSVLAQLRARRYSDRRAV